MKNVLLVLVLMFAYMGQASAKSLYCRLSHNLKNQDFKMALPALEPTPYEMGGFIGETKKVISSGDVNLELSLTLIDLDGMTFGNPDNKKEKSVSLQIKVLTDGLMPYSLAAKSDSLVQSFSDEINSSVSIDSSPMGFEGKFSLWCQSAPIR